MVGVLTDCRWLTASFLDFFAPRHEVIVATPEWKLCRNLCLFSVDGNFVCVL